MRVVRRFHYPLPAMPEWFAKYAIVEVAGERRLEWQGITRKQNPTEDHMPIVGECPVCGTDEVERQPTGPGEIGVDCPACSYFCVTQEPRVRAVIEGWQTTERKPDPDARYRASWAVRGWMDRSKSDGAVALDPHKMDGLLKQLRPWSAQRSERLLLQLIRDRSHAAFGLAEIGIHDWARVEVPGKEALHRLTTSLDARRELVIANTPPRLAFPASVSLTGQGEARLTGPDEQLGAPGTRTPPGA